MRSPEPQIKQDKSLSNWPDGMTKSILACFDKYLQLDVIPRRRGSPDVKFKSRYSKKRTTEYFFNIMQSHIPFSISLSDFSEFLDHWSQMRFQANLQSTEKHWPFRFQKTPDTSDIANNEHSSPVMASEMDSDSDQEQLQDLPSSSESNIQQHNQSKQIREPSNLPQTDSQPDPIENLQTPKDSTPNTTTSADNTNDIDSTINAGSTRNTPEKNNNNILESPTKRSSRIASKANKPTPISARRKSKPVFMFEEGEEQQNTTADSPNF